MSKLIVIEGTDCSGKETQSKLLEERLKKEGKKVVRFDFPMYDSPTGKIIGGAYLGKPEIGKSIFPEGAVNVDPYITCLYFAADRKYNMPKIEKYLNDDYYVILDRYTSSNQAHQGSKIRNKDDRFYIYQWIDKLEYWLLKLPKADKTIFLHMPLEVSNILKQNREFLDEHEKSSTHLKNSEEAYIELSELYNWDTIECSKNGVPRDMNSIAEDIYKIITKD